MQMTLICNICEKLALTLGTIGLIGFIVCLILAIELSVKTNLSSRCAVYFHSSLGIWVSCIFQLDFYFWLNIKECGCRGIFKVIIMVLSIIEWILIGWCVISATICNILFFKHEKEIDKHISFWFKSAVLTYLMGFFVLGIAVILINI